MVQILREPQQAFYFYEKYVSKPRVFATPLFKWAGGKTQLLPQIERKLPLELKTGEITRYAEPFVGGGALLFHVAQHYNIADIFISDQNPNLIFAYRIVQQATEYLIEELMYLEKAYHKLDSAQQKSFFYEMRHNFNRHQSVPFPVRVTQHAIEQAARMFFLNRTCFNGLYRVNRRGGFNVPFGGYENPKLCDAENIRSAAIVLESARILHGDFKESLSFIDKSTFVYCDPPYRPLTKTASFNSYASEGFDDHDQTRLAHFARQVDARGAKIMISNSDPHNQDHEDNFFVDLYAGFHLHKVLAKRMINSNGAGRGEITELLITNYETHTT